MALNTPPLATPHQQRPASSLTTNGGATNPPPGFHRRPTPSLFDQPTSYANPVGETSIRTTEVTEPSLDVEMNTEPGPARLSEDDEVDDVVMLVAQVTLPISETIRPRERRA